MNNINVLLSLILIVYNAAVQANPFRNKNPEIHADEAKSWEFPFIVSIGRKGDPVTKAAYSRRQGHFCGGSLISNRHVLTAAHCLVGEKYSNVRVLVGVVRFDDDAAAATFDVDSWMTYNEWSGRRDTFDHHDIAVVKLKEHVHNVQPVPLFTKLFKDESATLRTAGWGNTGVYNTSPTLLTISLRYLSNNECEAELCRDTNEQHLVNWQHMCTKSLLSFYLDSGDSGGPLTAIAYNRTYLVGVNAAFSTVSSCLINVHVRVSYYRHFIIAMLRDF